MSEVDTSGQARRLDAVVGSGSVSHYPVALGVDLLNLTAFPREEHGSLQHRGFDITKMQDSRAPSHALATPDSTPYIPLPPPPLISQTHRGA